MIAAGGGGTRFGPGRNKLLVDVAGLPVLAHSLRRFCPHLPDGHTIVVVSEQSRAEIARLVESERLGGKVRLVAGGPERQDSVLNGLQALPPTATIAAIHDAARPYASLALLEQCVAAARQWGSGVAAVRMRDTVKRVSPEGAVLETLDREELCAAETPQVFRRDLILRAYRQVAHQGVRVTDDAQAVELTGGTVRLVSHQEGNRKITLASDLQA